LKILLINKFHYLKGGSETYYFALAKALQSKGHEVIFFSMEDPQNVACDQSRFFVKNVDYNTKSIPKAIRSGLKLIYSREAKTRLKALIEAEKPDVAHLNLVHRQITLSIIGVLNRYSIPIVFTMHDLICVCPSYTMLSQGKICENCLKGNYMPCIRQKCVKNSVPKSMLAAAEAYFNRIRGVYNRVDYYITPSAFYRKKLMEGGFTKSAVVHIKNFLPMNTVYGVSNTAGDYFLYFGRLSAEKGILTLLKAVEAMDSPCKLVIAGAGPQQKMLEDYIASHKMAGRAVLAGFKTGAALESLVRDSRCIVLPSEWYENGPYSIMEALAKGKPEITSDLRGNPEMVEDGVNGYIFQAGNVDSLKEQLCKIRALDDAHYLCLCRAAVEKAKRDFYYEYYIDNLLRVYESLLKNQKIAVKEEIVNADT
jgi:glycosyltransferase involved in cell wall biosynthesis